jgi:hypothetical protein
MEGDIMFDASIRGWLFILVGAALTLVAARRKRSGPARATSVESWGERLCGIMLMIEGGATHLQAFADTRVEWLHWLALAAGCAGAALVCAGRVRRGRQARPDAV